MQFTERFDQHKLNHILQNKEKYTCRVYEQNYDPFNAAQKLLQKSTDGLVRVNYHQPGGRNFGRFFADGGFRYSQSVERFATAFHQSSMMTSMS